MGERIKFHFYSTLANKIFSFIFLFLQGVMVSRWLGPEGKGLQTKLITSIQVTTTFLELGLTSALIYFISSKKWRISQALGLSSLYSVFCFLFFVFIYIISSSTSFLDILYPIKNKTIFFILFFVLASFLEILRIQLVALLSARTHFHSINLTDSLWTLLKVFTLAILAFIWRSAEDLQKIHVFLVFDLIANFLLSFIYFLIYIKKIHETPTFNFNRNFFFNDLKNFAGQSYISNLINFLLIRIDYWFVEYFLGIKQLGIYSISVSLSTGLTFVPLAMNSILFPHLSQLNSSSQQKELFNSFSRFSNTLLFIIALALSVSAPKIIPFIFGNRFSESIEPFQIMVWGYWLASFKYLLGTYFKAINQIKTRLYSDILSLTVCTVLSFQWTPRGGLVGSSYAFLIAQIAGILCFFLLPQSKTLSSPKELMVARRSDLMYFIQFDFFKKTKP